MLVEDLVVECSWFFQIRKHHEDEIEAELLVPSLVNCMSKRGIGERNYKRNVIVITEMPGQIPRIWHARRVFRETNV
jgi:hypothetical protein